MKKIIVFLVCILAQLNAECLSSDVLVWANKESVFEVLEFKTFDPFLHIKDGEILNTKKYSKENFDWFPSFALWQNAFRMSYTEWKSYMTDEYSETYDEKDFEIVQERAKNDKEALKRTIISSVKFRYMENEYISIRYNRDFISELPDSSVATSMLFAKNNDKWLRALNVNGSEFNTDLFLYNFFLQANGALTEQVLSDLTPKNAKNIFSEIQFPRKVAVADANNSFSDCLFVNLETTEQNDLVDKFKANWDKSFWSKSCKGLDEVKAFLKFTHKKQQNIVLFSLSENKGIVAQRLVFDLKNKFITRLDVSGEFQTLFGGKLSAIGNIFDRKVFSLDVNGKIISGFPK
ncbi:MAG: hypothetical protein ACRC37_07595 [Lentisphaeria bacterium]